jgi:TnpA family transposase
VTTKDGLRAFKVITQYYDAHGADYNLDVKMYCIEKELQRRLSNTKKQTNITDFFTLRQNNV